MARIVSWKIHILLTALAAFLPALSAHAEESNRNEVRANLEQNDWSVIWGKNFTEGDWIEGTAAIAASITTENPGPFLRWFNETLDENFIKIERNLDGVARSDLERWIVQSLKQKQIITFKGFEIQAGFATYDRWDRIVYDEPRTRSTNTFPFFETYLERVERKTNLPNWHQFYIRYKLVRNGSKPNGGGGQLMQYTLTNDSRYAVTLSFSPSGTTSHLSPGKSTNARSPVRNGQFPKVKATTSNGANWERTIRENGGDYRIINRGTSGIQIVP